VHATVCIVPGTLDDVRGQSRLLAEQSAEVAVWDGYPLDVDWAMYEGMEQAGVLSVLLAVVDGEFAGFSIGSIVRHPHHEMTVMLNSAIGVAPAYRASTACADLIRETEAVAREGGCDAVIWSSPAGSPLAAIVQHRGYRAAETSYVRDI